ncbi:MAG: mycothiol synthase [Sciscionella sp.]
MVEIDWHSRDEEADIDRVRELLLAVQAADGRPEIAGSGPLPREFRGGEHALATSGGSAFGYLHLDTTGDTYGRQVAELYVHPDHRARGIGNRLVAELVRRARVTDGHGDRLRAWSHGDHPAAAVLAGRHGFERVRELRQMRLQLAVGRLPEPRLPAHVRLRTFQPGADERAVSRVNAHAFSWHPEQGALTAADIAATERESWFDPNGFFLAEAAGKLVGFHWTKVHPDGIGEVYVVGVDPAAQGGGLGKALTVVGLRYLAAQGLREVMLYVESDNPAAIAVYQKLGFVVATVDVQYSR